MEESAPNGRVGRFRDDGSLLAEITYERGVRHGPYRDYWSNGRLACEGQFAGGLQEGAWRFFNPDGSLREVLWFEGGKEVVD